MTLAYKGLGFDHGSAAFRGPADAGVLSRCQDTGSAPLAATLRKQ